MGSTSTVLRGGLALAGHVVAIAAFLLLPWAAGRGALAGRYFSGPELARLARNLDVFLPRSVGAASTLLALSLFLVPVASVAGALLAATARWSSHPAVALRASAIAGAIALAVALVTALFLLAGPAADQDLSRAPGAGVVLAAVGSLLAVAPACIATRRPSDAG